MAKLGIEELQGGSVRLEELLGNNPSFSVIGCKNLWI